MVKLTNEQAIERFRESGFEPLEEYKLSNIPIKCMDNNGYYYNIKLSNLSHNKTHNIIGSDNPFTIENIKTYLKKHNVKTELLSDTYDKCNKPLLFRCKCGKEFTMSWNTLKHKDRKYYCEDCMRSNAKRQDFNIVKEDFAKLGLTILDNVYKNNSTQILCETKNGYKIYVRYATIQRILRENKNKITEIFSITNNYDNVIYNLQHYCDINGINGVKPIRICSKEESKHKKRDIEFQCQCGEYFYTTIPTFIHHKRCLCDKCNERTSSYEKIVIDFLDNNNVDYIYQKTYDDCRDTLPLPFDFYIKDKNLIIEIDGEGHFQVAYFNNMSYEKALETYNITQKHDKIKNEYCKDKNITLIRIPYWDVLNNNYKQIIYENVIKD